MKLEDELVADMLGASLMEPDIKVKTNDKDFAGSILSSCTTRRKTGWALG